MQPSYVSSSCSHHCNTTQAQPSLSTDPTPTHCSRIFLTSLMYKIELGHCTNLRRAKQPIIYWSGWMINSIALVRVATHCVQATHSRPCLPLDSHNMADGIIVKPEVYKSGGWLPGQGSIWWTYSATLFKPRWAHSDSPWLLTHIVWIPIVKWADSPVFRFQLDN